MGMFDEQQLGVPSISFKRAKRGTVIEGVILPIRKRNASGTTEMVYYLETQDKDRATQEPKVYPSGDPVMVGRFDLQTELKDWDLASAEFEQRAAEDYPDETDDGKRRWYVGSKYANQAVREAFRRLKTAPEVGGRLTIKVTGIGSDTAKNGEKYTYPQLVVDWSPATDEGRKIADAYADSLPKLDDQGDAPSWATEPDL